MIKKKDFLELLRVKQWYKNVIIFIPLVFSGNFFNFEYILLTFIGFISLSLISSSYYIINDIKDIKKDEHHPEKKNRPITSGKISKGKAIFISSILFMASLVIAYFLSVYFLYMVIGLFFVSQFYTFYARDIIFLDIIIISINFVIRAISGSFLIEVDISPWIILSTFFISIFLVSGKREMEIGMKNFKNYRNHFNKNDKETLKVMEIISASSVIIFFSIYSILYEKYTLLISLPIAFYIIISYLHTKKICPEKIRNPEKFIFDLKNLIFLFIWFIIIITSLSIKS